MGDNPTDDSADSVEAESHEDDAQTQPTIDASPPDDHPANDPNREVSDEVLKAMEEGKEKGTISEHESREQALYGSADESTTESEVPDEDDPEDWPDEGEPPGLGSVPERDVTPGSNTNTTPADETPAEEDGNRKSNAEANTDTSPTVDSTTTTEVKRESDTSTESPTDPPSGPSQDDPSAPPEAEGVKGEDLDFEGLADDDAGDEVEWTWGQSKDEVRFEYKGMEVVMTEPDDDDEVLSAIRNAAEDDDLSEMDQLRVYAQLAIDQPTITQDRWENHMTPTERLTIGNAAAQYIEGEDFTAESVGGPSRQQDT